MKKMINLIILLFFIFINTHLVIADPIIHSVSPQWGDIRIPTSPILTINVSNDNSMDIVWYSNASGEWEIIGTNRSVESGIYQQKLEAAHNESTIYYWRVNISDNSSFLNETFRFKTEGWHVIFEWHGNWTIYAPDSVRNLSIINMNGEDSFRIIFDMKFYNYTGPIYIDIPGGLSMQTFYPDEWGTYKQIDVYLPKDNQILFPPGYQNDITIYRPDGLKLDSTDFFESYKREDWNVNIIGHKSHLTFKIYYATDWVQFMVYVILLSFIFFLNVWSWKKKRSEKISIGLTSIILPIIFFHSILSDLHLLSYEMFPIYLLSPFIIIFYFFNWRAIQK